MDWFSGLLDANLVSRILFNISGARTANAAADLMQVKKREAEVALQAQARTQAQTRTQAQDPTQAQHDVLTCECPRCGAIRYRILEDHRRSLSGNQTPNATPVRRPTVCAICRKAPPEPGLLTCRSCHKK